MRAIAEHDVLTLGRNMDCIYRRVLHLEGKRA
jgi:hypothetical protein